MEINDNTVLQTMHLARWTQ